MIDDSQFTKAQNILKSRQSTERDKDGRLRKNACYHGKYLLSGLIKCGICGETYLVGGKNSQYIYCQSQRHGADCKNRTFLPRFLTEKLVLQIISQK
ncbi:MAG: zinc ribbon domain-containing protein, partial [Planctomycetaceae bacterium]|nr:zinc ribbon domain-containing protein [Planctomycetaceae bacterium]